MRMISRAQSSTLARLAKELATAEARVTAAQARLSDVTALIMNEIRAIVAAGPTHYNMSREREHGTVRGYNQHIRWHEATCGACRTAMTDDARERRHLRAEQRGPRRPRRPAA